MTDELGKIEGIATSGSVWGLGNATDIRDMFYNTLRNAENIIQISTFSLGQDNNEVQEFFDILKERLKSQREVHIIVNDDGKEDGTCSKYAKRQISLLEEKFPEKFFPQFFKSTPGKILHAKITVVDRSVALVGSANISKGALASNYEIMLKIGKPAAGEISLMLDELSKELRRKDES